MGFDHFCTNIWKIGSFRRSIWQCEHFLEPIVDVLVGLPIQFLCLFSFFEKLRSL